MAFETTQEEIGDLFVNGGEFPKGSEEWTKLMLERETQNIFNLINSDHEEPQGGGHLENYYYRQLSQNRAHLEDRQHGGVTAENTHDKNEPEQSIIEIKSELLEDEGTVSSVQLGSSTTEPVIQKTGRNILNSKETQVLQQHARPQVEDIIDLTTCDTDTQPQATCEQPTGQNVIQAGGTVYKLVLKDGKWSVLPTINNSSQAPASNFSDQTGMTLHGTLPVVSAGQLNRVLPISRPLGGSTQSLPTLIASKQNETPTLHNQPEHIIKTRKRRKYLMEQDVEIDESKKLALQEKMGNITKVYRSLAPKPSEISSTEGTPTLPLSSHARQDLDSMPDNDGTTAQKAVDLTQSVSKELTPGQELDPSPHASSSASTTCSLREMTVVPNKLSRDKMGATDELKDEEESLLSSKTGNLPALDQLVMDDTTESEAPHSDSVTVPLSINVGDTAQSTILRATSQTGHKLTQPLVMQLAPGSQVNLTQLLGQLTNAQTPPQIRILPVSGTQPAAQTNLLNSQPVAQTKLIGGTQISVVQNNLVGSTQIPVVQSNPVAVNQPPIFQGKTINGTQDGKQLPVFQTNLDVGTQPKVIKPNPATVSQAPVVPTSSVSLNQTPVVQTSPTNISTVSTSSKSGNIPPIPKVVQVEKLSPNVRVLPVGGPSQAKVVSVFNLSNVANSQTPNPTGVVNGTAVIPQNVFPPVVLQSCPVPTSTSLPIVSLGGVQTSAVQSNLQPIYTSTPSVSGQHPVSNVMMLQTNPLTGSALVPLCLPTVQTLPSLTGTQLTFPAGLNSLPGNIVWPANTVLSQGPNAQLQLAGQLKK